eukprot:3143907-Heterocapsa_arctica.AAC.1
MGNFPEEFDQLDAKLTKAINLMTAESYINKNGQKVKGRQLMWVIYQFFKVDPNSGVFFGIEDLLAVEMHGEKLIEFLAEWDK